MAPSDIDPAPNGAAEPSSSIPGTFRAQDLRLFRALRTKALAVTLVAALVLLVGTLSVATVRNYQRDAALVEQSHTVRRTVTSMLQRMVDAETGQRGYLLTGDERFLGPFNGAAGDLATNLQSLRTLTQDDSAQRARVELLPAAVNARVNRISATIERRRTAGVVPTVEQLVLGKQEMDRLREVVAMIDGAEVVQLEVGSRAVARQARLAATVIVVGSSVIFILLVLINRGIRQDMAQNEQAQQVIAAQTRDLVKGERRYRFLADAIPVQVWTADDTGALNFVSAQVTEYFGVPANELLAAGWLSVIHPEDVEAVIPRWTHALSTGEPYEVSFRLRRRDGSYRWHLGRAIAFRQEGKAVAAWFGTNTDVHDQRETLEEQRRLSDFVEQLIDSTDEGIFSIDATGRCTLINRAAARLLDYSTDELLGEEVLEKLIAWDRHGEPAPADPDPTSGAGDAVPFEPAIAQTLRTGRASRGQGERFVRRDGQVIAVEYSAAPLTIADAPSGAVVAFADVTDRRRSEADRERLIGALERSNRELDQFAYVTSHDLKAPLRGIANLSLWIEEDMGEHFPDSAREHMGLLRGRVHRMEALIDGILEYSRAGRVTNVARVLSVQEVVQETVDLLAPPETARVDIPTDLPDLVSERIPLSQVFANLIGNALKHGGGDVAHVRIAWEREGAFMRFSVTDNGPGISRQYHERVFGVFQTLAARDKVEGTGIGLAIVKKIVEGKGGRVWIESPTDTAFQRGSTFHFTWPLEPVAER